MTAAIQGNNTPNLTTPSAVETSCLYSLAGKIRLVASALVDSVQRIFSAVWHFFTGSRTQPIPQPLPTSPTLLTPTPALNSPSASPINPPPSTTAAVISGSSSRSIDPTTLHALVTFDSRALPARPIQAALPDQPQDYSVSNTDLWLAASNVIQWGGYYLVKSAVESGIESSSYLNPAVIGASIAVGGALIHSLANYWMLPSDASLIRRATLIPFANALPVIGNPLGIFQRVSSLYTVSQNTLPKLASSAKTFTARPLHALTHGAVHAFNLGCEAVSLGTA